MIKLTGMALVAVVSMLAAEAGAQSCPPGTRPVTMGGRAACLNAAQIQQLQQRSQPQPQPPANRQMTVKEAAPMTIHEAAPMRTREAAPMKIREAAPMKTHEAAPMKQRTQADYDRMNDQINAEAARRAKIWSKTGRLNDAQARAIQEQSGVLQNNVAR